MKPFRPLLATDAIVDKIRWPVLASPKIDGIRGLVHNTGIMTRSNKPIPNRQVRAFFEKNLGQLLGLDGELVVGSETGLGVMQRASSGLMSYEGTPDFTFRVFDTIDYNAVLAYGARATIAREKVEEFNDPRVTLVRQEIVGNIDQLNLFNLNCIASGYEGCMLRDPNGFYKQGRSSVKEGIILKVKVWADNEAVVIGFKERMHNTNEQVRSELGLAKRSTAKDGMVGTNMLGALRVRGLNGDFKDKEFDIGGYTHAQATDFWLNQDQLIGKIAKYKHFPIGVKDLPRFPGFLGFRDPADM